MKLSPDGSLGWGYSLNIFTEDIKSKKYWSELAFIYQMSKSQTAGLWSVVRWKQDKYLFMLHCMGTFIEVIPEKCTVVCYLACWLPQRAVVKSSQGASPHKLRLAQLAIYGHGPCGASCILMSLCVELTRLQHGGGSYKKELHILRFRHNEVNLRLLLMIIETPQKVHKICQMGPQNWPHYLRSSWCKVNFFINLIHSPTIWLLIYRSFSSLRSRRW